LAEFGTAPEDKYKLSLLSIEKRFVELEVAIGELQQKVQALQTPQSSELEERVGDLEDVIFVEQAGIEELKGMLEANQEKKPEEFAQEVQKIIDPVVVKIKADIETSIQQVRELIAQLPQQTQEIYGKINDLEKRIQPQQAQNPEQLQEVYGKIDELENRMEEMKNLISEPSEPAESSEEMKGMNARIDQLEGQMKAVPHFRAELENLRNKVEPMNPETIKSVIGELSDLRIETSRELREVKERVGDAPLYADIQFLSNRIKDLKLAMDNLLNMKVEIDARILNMERNMAERGGSSSVSANLINEMEDTKKIVFGMQKRISSIDGQMKGMMSRQMQGLSNDKQTLLMKDMESMYTKMNELYADAERKTLDLNRLSNLNINDKIAEMSSKVGRMEEELHHIKSRPAETVTRPQEDQLKEILEQLILLQTRVNVLETSVLEPKRMHPIILE
jgi:CII-binding regulator of phage lambda lysogenization HflD